MRMDASPPNNLIKPPTNPTIILTIPTKLPQPNRHPVLIDLIRGRDPSKEQRPSNPDHETRSTAVQFQTQLEDLGHSGGESH